jgi:hypothetical protein
MKGRSLIEVEHVGQGLEMDVIGSTGENNCERVLGVGRFCGNRIIGGRLASPRFSPRQPRRPTLRHPIRPLRCPAARHRCKLRDEPGLKAMRFA